jgi:hypothetical protein
MSYTRLTDKNPSLCSSHSVVEPYHDARRTHHDPCEQEDHASDTLFEREEARRG